jgi:RNA ligase (TIGR02306 family)
MSTFSVPLIYVGYTQPLPNSDTLSITQIEGCPVIFKTGDFKEGDLAIYVPIEAIVPLDNPAFAFLKTKEGQTTYRIKAKRLRGTFSMGLLVPAYILGPGDPYQHVGEDVSSILGIVKYEEPEENMVLGGRRIGRTPDTRFAPIYDIDSIRKYWNLFCPGERVIVTEKIHGCNTRASFRMAGDDTEPRLYVGSRKFFNIESDTDAWWMAAKKYGFAEKLKAIPGLVLFGEIYGQVQDLKYGTTQEDPIRFAAFDLYDSNTKQFMDYDKFKEICDNLKIPTVPVLYDGPFDRAVIEPMAAGMTVAGPTGLKQMREGFVMKPEHERWDDKLGRVIVKLVGEEYLLRKGGTEHH